MTKLFHRVTRECSVERIARSYGGLVAEDLARAEVAGDPFSNVVMCIEVRTKKTKSLVYSSSARDPAHVQVYVLTDRWLHILTTERQNGRPIALTYRLGGMEVSDYEDTEAFKLIEDSGLELTSILEQTAKQSTYFIGLGKEPLADAFRNALRRAADERTRQVR